MKDNNRAPHKVRLPNLTRRTYQRFSLFDDHEVAIVNEIHCCDAFEGMVDAGVCITPVSDSQLLAIIRAGHALLAAGDTEAATDLLASFSSPGVDALC